METIKRLFRSRKHKIIGGVCGGISEYVKWDPVLVRLIFVALLFCSGGYGLLAYIIGWIIIPIEPKEEIVVPEVKEEPKEPFWKEDEIVEEEESKE
jgi:phage shock protein C